MSDRPLVPLPELQRQRDLVAAHLAWLDAAIARARPESPAAPLPVVPVPAAEPSAFFPSPATATAFPEGAADLREVAESSAERILAQYRAERGDVRTETRRGCLLYLILALGLLALAAGAWWMLQRRTS